MPSNQDSAIPASSSEPASKRKARTPNSARLVGRPEKSSGTEAHGSTAAESSGKLRGPPKIPLPKIDLKALFDYRTRKKRERSLECARAERATKRKSPEPRTKRPRLRIPRKELMRRYAKKGFQFSFMQKLYGQKHVPFRMECLFEQEALKGFFEYIRMLKFEEHLKKSLSQMDAADDLENECLESRKHKYLDDEGPLSPIAESNGEDLNENRETESIGARIVENSCFILSSDIPKKKAKKTTKS